MSAAKKFGTFAGVYTPSVLTILGVIMYMRLGWVVGEAGLIGTIIIVLVAHIISITTGLSISSIATDKKIKTGGIYYILSRSLGLPMGGSIGITLFVGTALSIALYIVGFTENFLGIEAISNFLGMANDINSIRIIGSIVLIILFVIAFISTSLAIKSQFFVLGAIALSLVSIFLGFVFVDPSAMPEVAMTAAPNHVPIMTIFAIFFPAVTGFTAGVAMSGDLKDPKTSIPKGTMLAIATGLVVYIALSVGIAYFVDRDVLINDSNFLVKIAIYSPLVIAGIWGATLSSALGGILGAPRIVQAIANDKIVPKFLGKGYGESNEPRNALIFTFFIAELGIIIGELDAIAEVVSMFYIAAYGFINLAFALEKWASTDFRPSFSISKWIGIIGFIASFGVMLELNPGAMIAAFIIMWLIYFLLKRKEIKSDFGDVWGSVWSSMVRTSITKMTEKSLEKRNWKPNILLFSGKPDDRPHLLELSKKLVGKYGFLSHFDLQVVEDEDVIYAKRDQILNSEEQAKGIFYRRKSVKNVYDGIEQISSTYGFAGVEPNTVFLGWARNTQNPSRFVNMLRNLYRLDLNVIMMDYDHNVGFGDKKQIDVWWRGKGQNGNLSLQLIKFIRESDDWSKARLRLIILNNNNEDYEEIYRQAQQIIDNLRIEADIRVINNQIEKRSFYDIVQEESINSSLIFMGLPEISDSEQDDFVNRTNDLCKKIGTVILVKASSSFIDLSIGVSQSRKQKDSTDNLWILPENKGKGIESVNFPKYKKLAYTNRSIYDKLESLQTVNNQQYLKVISDGEMAILSDFEKVINTFSKSLKLVINSSNNKLLAAKVSSIQTKVIGDIEKKVVDYRDRLIIRHNEIVTELISAEVQQFKDVYSNLPRNILVNYSIDDLAPSKTDNLDVKWFKFTNRVLSKLGKKNFKYNIKYRQLLVEKVSPLHNKYLIDFVSNFGIISSQNITAFEKFFNDLDHEMQFIYQKSIEPDSMLIDEIDDAITRMKNLFSNLKNDIVNRTISLAEYRKASLLKLISDINSETSIVAVNLYLDEEFNTNKTIRRFGDDLVGISDKLFRNENLLLNHALISIQLLQYSVQFRQISHLTVKRLHSYLQNDIVEANTNYLNYLVSYLDSFKKDDSSKFDYDTSSVNVLLDKISADNLVRLIKRNHKNLLNNLPKEVVILSNQSDNLIGTDKQFDDLETVNVSVVRLMDYIIQDEFINIIQTALFNLSEEIIDKNQKIFDRARILKFQIGNNELDSKAAIKLLEEEIDYVKTEIANGQEYLVDAIRRFEERRRVVDEKLGVYPFLQSAMNLKQYIRTREAEKRGNRFAVIRQQIYNFYSNQAAKLLYRHSINLMLTQSFMNDERDSLSIHKKQARAIGDLHKNEPIVDKLPVYYRQLFTDNQNFIPELWVENKKAEAEVERYLNDFAHNNSRALLIRGQKGTGKSFLANRMVSMLESEGKAFTIAPPESGSVNIHLFKRAVSDILEIQGEKTIAALADGTSLVFEDAELWWQKSENGFAVLDYIFDIIKQFSSRLRIIVIINNYSFDFISNLRKVNDYFTHDVQLSALDASTLQQIIWKRHSMGGLNLSVDGKEEASFHSWDFARLFNRFFRISKGNPLAAIMYWLYSITAFEAKEMEMSAPKIPVLRICEDLSQENLWVLQMIVLHNNMTVGKLSSVTNFTTSVAMNKLFELAQIGFIKEYSPNVYSINVLMNPFVENVLKSKKYL
jgi:amino acid transporter